MPLDDPRQVRSLEDAFDLTNPQVQLWELHLIWRAMAEGLVRLDAHARHAALADSIPLAEIERIVLGGLRWSKDAGTPGRQVGINFDGRIAGGRWVRAKVSWFVGYVVATVHTL